jgi:hypothetical protein
LRFCSDTKIAREPEVPLDDFLDQGKFPKTSMDTAFLDEAEAYAKRLV